MSDAWDLSDFPEVAADEDRPDPETAAFYAEKRSAITSTDVPKVLGLSKWGTPLTVYLDKVAPPPERKPGLSAWLGLRLEGLVAELFTTAKGLRVRTDNGFYRHPDYPFLGTHLDRRVVGRPKTLVELKTRGSRRGWGDDGSADVPPDVWLQVQDEMYVTGATDAYVAVLFSTREYRTYHLLPDPRFETDIVPALVRFWHHYVEAGVPPAPSGAKPDTDLLQQTDGGVKDTGLLSATTGQESMIDRLRLAMAQASIAAMAAEEHKNLVKQLIGDAEGIAGTFGTITWRRSKDRSSTDWEAVAAVYRRAIERLHDLLSGSAGDAAEIASEVRIVDAGVATAESLYTTTVPGSRVFLTHFKED
jgi:predicted phage-related endonuclease